MHRRRRRRRRSRPVVLMVLPVVLIVGIAVFLLMNKGIISYWNGKRAIRNEKYQQASVYLQKATKKEPKKKSYRIAYGISLSGLGDYENALEEFKKAVPEKTSAKQDKIGKQAYRGMGICYFFAKSYEKSISYFDKALAINELEYLNLDIVKYKADANAHLGNYEEAVKLYTEVVKKDNYSDDMYLKRAYAEAENGQIDEAIADYDLVIAQNEKNFDAYIGAYMLLMEEEADEKADSYLKAALEVKPDTLDEKLKYAVVQYYYYGITEEAVDSLKKLVEENKPEAYFYLAKISLAEQDYESVSSYLNSYVSKKNVEHLAEAYEMLGRNSMLEKNYKDALNWFETGIACNDAKWTGTLMRDQIATYEYLSDYENAYHAALEYLKDYPDDKDVQRELEFIMTRRSEK